MGRYAFYRTATSGYIFQFIVLALSLFLALDLNLFVQNWPTVAQCVHVVLKDYPRLRLTHGRKVFIRANSSVINIFIFH